MMTLEVKVYRTKFARGSSSAREDISINFLTPEKKARLPRDTIKVKVIPDILRGKVHGIFGGIVTQVASPEALGL